jgi:hypothetical protein
MRACVSHKHLLAIFPLTYILLFLLLARILYIDKMSLSLVPQETFRVVDPRLDFGGKSYYAIPQGAKKISVQRELASSGVSASNWTFNFYTPSPETVVSRRIRLRTSYVITIRTQNAIGAIDPATAGSGPVPAVNVGVTDAPRAFPVHNFLQTMSCTLNGNCNITMNTSDVFSALQHVNGRALYRVNDTAPWFPDNTLEYDSVAPTQTRNALGSAQNWEWDYPRGAYQVEILACRLMNGTTTIAERTDGAVYSLPMKNPDQTPVDNNWYWQAETVVRVSTVEPLMLSPFQWICDGVGMRGIQSMSFQFSFLSDPARLWSHINQNLNSAGPAGIFAGCPQNNIDNVTGGGVVAGTPYTLWGGYNDGTASNQPELVLEYLTVPVTIPVPLVTTLPYREIVRYPQSATPPIPYSYANKFSLASGLGQVTEIQSQSVYLTAIPEAVLLYVRPANQLRDVSQQATSGNAIPYYVPVPGGPGLQSAARSAATIPDAFYPISKISMQWNNSTGLLDTAPQSSLYEMCKRNGLDSSWIDFIGRTLVTSSAGGKSIGRSTAGAPIILRFGYEIPLDEGQAPGLRGSWNFQARVTVNNPRAQFPAATASGPINTAFGSAVAADGLDFAELQQYNAFLPQAQPAQLFMVFIYPGTVTFSNLSTQKDIGVVSPGDIVQSMIKPDVPADVLRAPYGGSFLSDRAEMLRGAGMVSMSVPAYDAGGAVRSGGVGLSGGELSGGAMEEECAAVKKPRTGGAAASGGRAMSSNGLGKRLRELQRDANM